MCQSSSANDGMIRAVVYEGKSGFGDTGRSEQCKAARVADATRAACARAARLHDTLLYKVTRRRNLDSLMRTRNS